ncbi:phage portal protein [Billgrantia bachuensis]|uniref:Phage portal protein n=1 Tax=Billgrantia bachuensis TaxID=2717286 RepID=A0ABX0PPN6_9GAMM|nr:phage portal protein [Halomonas bachuensis]NIC05240.1 phage portal protein [Halomonas bachuensis]
MKPIDIENAILVALRRSTLCGDPQPLTIPALVKRLTTAKGEGPGWRQVANAVLRLERQGLIYIAAEEEVGEVMQPAYQLTGGGVHEASKASLDDGLPAGAWMGVDMAEPGADMTGEFLAFREFDSDQICRIFGVRPYVLGNQEER